MSSEETTMETTSPAAPEVSKPRPEVTIIDQPADEAALARATQKTKTFTLIWEDKDAGVTRQGSFTARRPTLGMLGQIAVMRAKLNGGERVDVTTDYMHSMIADLQFILTETPEWWNPGAFFSSTPLITLHNHVEAWLKTFRGAVD